MHASLLFFTALAPALALGQTNLPDVPPGVFNASARIEINAPLSAVWDVVLDFPSYPEWNPFVRSQIVTDALFVPLADQTPHENLRLIINVQTPPLTPPVSASTPPNPLNAQTSFENITHIDFASNRVAWRQIFIPQAILDAERWTALSIVDGETTLYESREVYGGPLAYTVRDLFADGLQEGFEAMATALKIRVEGS